MTMSAVVKLIPRPPARVVNRKMNFSLPGLLYSSIASIRLLCAVLPSIRQYSAQRTRSQLSTRRFWTLHTEAPEQAIVFKDVQHSAHLTEDQHTRALLVHGL